MQIVSPSHEQKQNFKRQTPWKHNKALQLVSSIHLHRRNTFPSHEQFIDNRSHRVPKRTPSYVNSFAWALRIFLFPHDIKAYIAQFFHLKQKSAQVQDGQHNLKTLPHQRGLTHTTVPFPPPPHRGSQLCPLPESQVAEGVMSACTSNMNVFITYETKNQLVIIQSKSLLHD